MSEEAILARMLCESFSYSSPLPGMLEGLKVTLDSSLKINFCSETCQAPKYAACTKGSGFSLVFLTHYLCLYCHQHLHRGGRGTWTEVMQIPYTPMPYNSLFWRPTISAGWPSVFMCVFSSKWQNNLWSLLQIAMVVLDVITLRSCMPCSLLVLGMG